MSEYIYLTIAAFSLYSLFVLVVTILGFGLFMILGFYSDLWAYNWLKIYKLIFHLLTFNVFKNGK